MRGPAAMFVARSLLAAWIVSLAAPETKAGDPELPSLRVVFFTPADVEPPAGVRHRLTQVADSAERFLAQWMRHWGYEPAVEGIFRRDPDGAVEVLFVKGEHPLASGRYDKPGFAGEVMDKAVRQYQVPRNRNLWWIFVYLGDPPTRFTDYRGHGEPRTGGWAMVNYDSTPGELRPEEPLGTGFNERFTLKGCIHELGHAFGLPHIGPNPGQALGVPLMGANMDVAARLNFPRRDRVYLTEAAAAMLWKHPVFSGTAEDRDIVPEVRLEGYEASFDRRRRRVALTGKLVSNYPAHSVVVLDDMDKKPGPYWVRSYAERLEEDGTFRVVIDEPVASDGRYKIVFCFENGAVTGDGMGHGGQGAIVKPYRFVRGTLQFEP